MPNGDLTVTGSEPLPELTVKSSEALPTSEPQYRRVMVPGQEGFPVATEVPTNDPNAVRAQYQAGMGEGAKAGLAGVGSAVLPELMPELGGGGILAYMTRLLGKIGLTGAGAGLGTVAGQAASGQNPLSPENLKQTSQAAATAGAASAPFEAVAGLGATKMGRAAINQSLGATARDVMYGNPAKALLDEKIAVPTTGDFELYKDALRQGKSEAQATRAAGGRMGAVNAKINQYGPQLQNQLQSSNATIPVKRAIIDPLDNAAMDVIMNPAMTMNEKDAVIQQLGGLQKEMTQGLGPNISPEKAWEIKKALGDRINWIGTQAVGDEVKPAYRNLYGSLKNEIYNAVPSAKNLDERLTNLYAAENDIKRLAMGEEVGRGAGPSRGTIGKTALGLAQSQAGRALPAATQVPQITRPVIGSLAESVTEDQNKP